MFNPHNNVTADGVVITIGLRVWTNEMEVGTVISDDENREFGCCQPTSEAGSDQTLDEAWRVGLLTEDQVEHLVMKGQTFIQGVWFSNHKFQCELSTTYCRHDHWFRVMTPKGTKSFNGERLATVFEGRKATQERAKEYN